MSEINWDLAPESAVGLAASREDGEVMWVRKDEGGSYNGWSLSEWDTTVTDDYEIIATRPQTKTVADEQEGEKWTHYTEKGYKCKISLSEPDSYGSIVILSEHNVYIRCYPEDINPIKPKLTEDAMKAVERFAYSLMDKDSYDLVSEVNSFREYHEII